MQPEKLGKSEETEAGDSSTGHTVKGSKPVGGGFAPVDEHCDAQAADECAERQGGKS